LRLFISHIIFLAFLFFNLGCGGLKDNQVPKVHQAWDARYHYDLENRRMISKYDNKKIGRSIGRDEWGRIDHDRYWVMKPFKGENLLEINKSKLNAERDLRWEEANSNLIEARKIELAQISTIDGEGGTESLNEDSEIETTESDEFLPAPFLPQGIDMEPSEPMNTDFNEGIPQLPEAGLGDPNDLDTQEPPSPFAPLPPL